MFRRKQSAALQRVFLATLSPTQRSGVQFPFNRTTASSKWSNLPRGAACRNGLQFSTSSATQLEAALAVAQAALSSAGYGTFHGIRMADDVLGAIGAPNVYNSGIYFITFISTPSSTGEWILQLAGHHAPLKPKTDAMVGMIAGLDATQRAAAKLSGTFGDVLLGPADDTFSRRHPG